MPKYDWLNLASREVDQVARGRMTTEAQSVLAPVSSAMTGSAMGDAVLAELAAARAVSGVGMTNFATTVARRNAGVLAAGSFFRIAERNQIFYTADGSTDVPVTDQMTGDITPQAYGARGDYAGIASYITAQDILDNASLPATDDGRWRGAYIAGVHTYDFVGLQEAIYRAFAPLSTPGNIVWSDVGNAWRNKRLFIPAGQYYIGNRSLYIQHLYGGNISGAGAKVTLLMADKYTNILRINGVSKARILDIGFYGISYTGAASGRVFWTPNTAYSVGDRIYTTYGMQSGYGSLNDARGTIWECVTGGTSGASEPTWEAGTTVADNTAQWIAGGPDGANRQYGIVPLLWLTHDGDSFAGTARNNYICGCHFETDGSVGHNVGIRLGESQASQTSEHLVENCQFTRCQMAAVLQEDLDAQQNTFLTCNFQDCRQGAIVGQGGFYVISCGFQNGRYNSGWSTFGALTQIRPDMYIFGGANTSCLSLSNRVESHRHVQTVSGVRVVVMNLQQTVGYTYEPALIRSTSAIQVGDTCSGIGGSTPDGMLYECTKAGVQTVISGGTASGGSTTTIVDAGAAWATNEHADRTVQATAGAGAGQSATIISNTADTLTFAAQPVAFDATTVYSVFYTRTTAASIPNWAGPSYGGAPIVMDGTIEWTQREFTVVSGPCLTIVDSQIQHGSVSASDPAVTIARVRHTVFSRDWWDRGVSMTSYDNYIARYASNLPGWFTAPDMERSPDRWGWGEPAFSYRRIGQATYDFASVPANAWGLPATVNVTGAVVGDFAEATISTNTGLILHAVVTAANTVTVTPYNPTASAIDLASGTLKAYTRRITS